MDYDFLLLGDYFFDMIYTGLPGMPRLGCELYTQNLTTTGGAMFITAVAMRRLGAKVGWATHFGDDYYSQFVRQLALSEDLDLALVRQLPHPYRRVTTSLTLESERAFVTFTDPDANDIQTYWLEAMDHCSFRHLHLGGLMLPDEAAPLIQKARSKGATVSMDCQDMPMLREQHPWHTIISAVDIFMPNAREAMLMTGAPDAESALRQLTSWGQGRVIVIKDGPNGAWAGQAGQITHRPAIHVPQVIDTTGAGDCFNAGFLFAHIVQQQPLDFCLHYGNFCGGHSVQGIGGATTAPTYDQLQQFINLL